MSVDSFTLEVDKSKIPVDICVMKIDRENKWITIIRNASAESSK